MRFRVNGAASNVIIGIAMVPAIALLCLAFGLGLTPLGLGCGGGFLAILMLAGLIARGRQRELEVDERGIREPARGIEIRWNEPHTLDHQTRTVTRLGVPMTSMHRIAIAAGDRQLRFSVLAKGGVTGLAARMPNASDLRAGDDAVTMILAYHGAPP
jgi:hypothetical protein